MPLRWTLHELLAAHGLTPYRLMKESGLPQGTTYRLANGRASTIGLPALEAIIAALRRLTGEEIAVSDLLRYEEGGSDGQEASRRGRHHRPPG